jgi:hypothetical protein
MSKKDERIRFAFFMGRNSNLAVGDVLTLMRLAATHCRIETELTNGYKLKNGNQDQMRTHLAIAKRDRIDKRMESLCRISYGALTVSVVIQGREVHIP